MADYRYWRDALAGDFGPVHDGDPQPGFYRAKVLPGRDSPWTPIAIWPEADGSLVAMKHMYVVERPLIVPAEDVWTFCCDNPIPEIAYRAKAELGQPWPSVPYPTRQR